MEVIKGRMYDYNNGRFLSVDPFIQNPSSTQSMNPYTYIGNNPLSGTDPSGYYAQILTKLPQILETAGAVISAAETGIAIGTTAYEVNSGQKSLSDALLSNGKDAAIGIGIGMLTAGAGKIVEKFIPDSVKKKASDKVKKAFSNGNKNKQQSTATNKNKDVSTTEANSDQNMIDNVVNKRKDTAGATGDDTFAQARGKNGEVTDTFQDIKDPGGDPSKNIHAETQALGALEDTRGATIAVDQIPCSNCTGDLKSAGVDKVIVPTKGGNKINNSPKTAAVDAATKGKTVKPREIDLNAKK